MRIHKGSGRQFHGSGIKVPEYSFQRIRFKLSSTAQSEKPVGMEESSPQKSSISTLVEDEPCETRKEIRLLGRDFFASLEIGIGIDSIL